MEEIIETKKKLKKRRKSDKLVNYIFDGLTIICIIIIAIGVTPKTFQNDTFYNIKCGEYILKNGISNLTQDPFSWHKLPYTWPHWLYDLGTYIIYHIARKLLGSWILYYYNSFNCNFGYYFI